MKSKETLDRIYAKYYGKEKSKTQKPETSLKPKESEAGDALSKGLSRNELMLKAKGIKNFRIINKEELVEILKDGTTNEHISEIVAGTLARWKNGWRTSRRKHKIEK